MRTDNGFTFNGRHSSEFHIYCNPETRVLLPEKRRLLTTIPGRSGAYAQEDGGFNPREESFICTYTGSGLTDISEQSRAIAAWLSKTGTLSFDHEPGKSYTATFVGSPPLAKHLQYGEFTLTFQYSPPFAFSEPHAIEKTILQNDTAVIVPIAGTAPSPCRIIIDNIGNSTIENLRIAYQHN